MSFGACALCGRSYAKHSHDTGDVCNFFIPETTRNPECAADAIGISRKDMAMAIRCKMRLEDVMRTSWGARKAFFRCDYDQKLAEDVSFSKATPSGSAEFMIDNPKATEQLVIGESYYVDFHPVPKVAPASPT